MKKIGFVTPWYGEKIPGGAEMELRGLVEHFSRAGVDLEVLTTCVKEFASDWNVDYHKAGMDNVRGIPVRRFKVRKRDTQAFDAVNYKLMNRIPVTSEEEAIYIREMVNSTDLYDYMAAHKDEYSLFVYIPYMFGTTYYGCLTCPEKSVVIPCLHDESYAYLNIFKEAFSKIAGMIYLAQPEYALANRLYDLSRVRQAVLGAGVQTDLTYESDRFTEKYQIKEPFILYAGRKDSGKNVHVLIKYFCEYKKRHENDLKLVLIGGGSIDIPSEMKNVILDLGYVDMQDKYDAYGAATLLCQPSPHESFSLVIMESWLCNRPVLVSEQCEVTKHFAIDTHGGLYFSDYFDFEGCVDYYMEHPETAAAMGQNGRSYVMDNFSWDVIVEKYMAFFKSIVE